MLRPDIDRYREKNQSKKISEDGRAAFEAQIDKWQVLLQALDKQVADATIFLPQYDVKQAQVPGQGNSDSILPALSFDLAVVAVVVVVGVVVVVKWL